jgi:hypothetical protein
MNYHSLSTCPNELLILHYTPLGTTISLLMIPYSLVKDVKHDGQHVNVRECIVNSVDEGIV